MVARKMRHKTTTTNNRDNTMKQFKDIEIENFPVWAIGYLANGLEDGDTTQEDIEMIESFLSEYGLTSANFSDYGLDEEGENGFKEYTSFNHRPCFGLACSTCTITFLQEVEVI